MKELRQAAKEARKEADATRRMAEDQAQWARLTPKAVRRQRHPASRDAEGGEGPGGGLREASDGAGVTPPSPSEKESKRRELEEKAAAAAVLETIIRQLARRVEKRVPLRQGVSGAPTRRASLSTPPPAEGRKSPDAKRGRVRDVLARLREAGKLRVSRPELTKEEWDEAISDALF